MKEPLFQTEENENSIDYASAVCINFHSPPQLLSVAGSKRLGFIFPCLIVCDCVSEHERFAQVVAEVLSENRHRFASVQSVRATDGRPDDPYNGAAPV